jgi:hypothetical protein
LNGLHYGPYPEEGSNDARDASECNKRGGAKRGGVDEGCSKGKVVVPPMKKRRKVDGKAKGLARATGVEEASDKFAEELAETCAEPRECESSRPHSDVLVINDNQLWTGEIRMQVGSQRTESLEDL